MDGTAGTKTGQTNNWTTVPITDNDPQRKEWIAGTPIPARDLLGVPGPSNTQKTAQACEMIPGCMLDSGGTPVIANIETVDNGAPSVDGMPDNVLDGFVIDVDDFDLGEMLSFNWFLTDASGNPIGVSGQGNDFGFGTFNVFRTLGGDVQTSSNTGVKAIEHTVFGPALGERTDGSGSNIGTSMDPSVMFVAATILGTVFLAEAAASMTLPFQNSLDNVLDAPINGRLLRPLAFLALLSGAAFTITVIAVLSGGIHAPFILLILLLGFLLNLAGSLLPLPSGTQPEPGAITATITLPDPRNVSDPAPTAGEITFTGPSPWVSVTGPLATDGSFTATGTGEVAGRPNIAVKYEGNLTAAGKLTGTYTMGVNGGLDGVPIEYQVDAEMTPDPQAPAPLPSPTLPENSVVNGASFRPATDPNGAVAPGTIISIFGTDLLDESQAASADFLPAGRAGRSAFGNGPRDISASGVPLPTTLGGTSVRINNLLAPLFFVSSTQINVQLPFGLPSGTYPVQVFRGGTATVTQNVTVAGVSPGIFVVNPQGAGAVLHAATFQLVTDANPAQAGEFLSIFATGLGPLDAAVTSGDVPPTPPPLTLSTPQITIGGIPATVSFSGLAPGFVGLYQVNVQVPAATPSGTQNLELTIDGVPSNTVTIAVQ